MPSLVSASIVAPVRPFPAAELVSHVSLCKVWQIRTWCKNVLLNVGPAGASRHLHYASWDASVADRSSTSLPMSSCCFFSLTLLIRQTLRKVLNIKIDFLLGTFWLANQLLLTFTHLSPEMSSHMEDWGTEFPVWPSPLSIHCYGGTRPPWKHLSQTTQFFPHRQNSFR